MLRRPGDLHALAEIVNLEKVRKLEDLELSDIRLFQICAHRILKFASKNVSIGETSRKFCDFKARIDRTINNVTCDVRSPAYNLHN